MTESVARIFFTGIRECVELVLTEEARFTGLRVGVIAVVAMICLSEVVGAEIAIDDGQIEDGRFRDVIEFRAREAVFDLAVRGATVAICEVSVVTFFTGFDEREPVATRCFADAVVAAKDGFDGALRGAAITGIQIAVIADFAFFDDAVSAGAFFTIFAIRVAGAVICQDASRAAFRGFIAFFGAGHRAVSAFFDGAFFAGSRAFPAHLDLAIDATAAGLALTFIAGFVAGDKAIAAHIFFAGFAGHGAVIAFFAFAVFGAAIFRIGISIVAFFVAGDDSVPASTRVADAWRIGSRRAEVSVFDGANGGAAVTGGSISIVTGFVVGDEPVSASVYANGLIVGVCFAAPAFFDGAARRAAVARGTVSVVAELIFIDDAVAAEQRGADGFSIDGFAGEVAGVLAFGRAAVVIGRISVVALFVVRDFSVAAVVDALTAEGTAAVF